MKHNDYRIYKRLFRRNRMSDAELMHKMAQFMSGNSYFVGNSPVVWYTNNFDFVKNAYSKNAEVFSIINKITDKANVAVPFLYIDKSGVKSKRQGKTYQHTRKNRADSVGMAKHRLQVSKDLEFADMGSDLANLLLQPNENETWRDLMTLVRIFYFLQGEAFLYREAGDDLCAQSIHIAPPNLMSPIIDSTNIDGLFLKGWKLDLLNGRSRYFDKDEVFHLKMPNPNFDGAGLQFRGFSPLISGLKYLKLSDSSLESWAKSVENEGAKGIISPNHADPKLWLTPGQTRDTQKMAQEKIHGSDNKNKIVVSAMPLQYTHIGLSPDALNVISALDKSQVKLNDLWGVPAVLFEPNPTYQNQQAGAKRFLREVIIPYLNIEEDKLNQWLVEPFKIRDNIDYVIDYDTSMYDELRLSVDQTDALLRTHTINEVRVMLGSDESKEEYANQIFVQQGMLPLSDYGAEMDFLN